MYEKAFEGKITCLVTYREANDPAYMPLLSEEQKDELFKSGNFTPGDFGTLYKKLKFVSKEKINSEFICQELISLAKLKNNGFEKTNKIGFSI